MLPKERNSFQRGGRGSEPVSYFLSPPDSIDLSGAHCWSAIFSHQCRRDHTKRMHLVFDSPPPFGITFHFLMTLNFTSTLPMGFLPESHPHKLTGLSKFFGIPLVPGLGWRYHVNTMVKLLLFSWYIMIHHDTLWYAPIHLREATLKQSRKFRAPPWPPCRVWYPSACKQPSR